ncbi:MAG: hypothetical protein OSA98_21070 [Rubripirellula sp.]|nr:hypothetical protein [Rubripirellula sp.]
MVRPNTPCRVLAPPVVAPPVVATHQDAHASQLEQASGSYPEPCMADLRGHLASPWLYVAATGLLVIGVCLSSSLTRPNFPGPNHALEALPTYVASSPSQSSLPEPPKGVTDRQATTTEIAVSPASLGAEPNASLGAEPNEPMIPNQDGDPNLQQGSVLVTADLERNPLATLEASEPSDVPAVATPIVESEAWRETESDDLATTVVQEPAITSIAPIATESDKNDDIVEVTLTQDPAGEHRLTSLDPELPQWQWDAQHVAGLESAEATAPMCADGQCPTSLPTYGTTIQWAASPADAYQRAEDENKLVFMMHVSGNFKIPGFT